MITRRCASYLLGLTLVVAACGSEDAGPQVSASQMTETPTTTRPPETRPPDSTASPSTATAPAAPSTTSSPPTSAVGLPDTILVGWDNGVIAEHDLRTGKIVKTITTEAYPEGRFFGDLHRGPNATVYVASGYEDSWYSCDYIDGDISVIDTDGSIDRIAAGGPPIISPDGTKLAYLTSSDCVTDPDNEMWFVSNIDTLVVRTLATGAERSWTFPGARYETSAPSVLRSPVWANGAVLVMSGDRVVRVDVTSPAVPPISSGTQVTLTSASPHQISLLRTRSDRSVVAAVWPWGPDADGTPQRLVVIDPTTGAELSEIASSTTDETAEPYTVDQSGEHWATINDNRVVVDGRSLSLEQPERGDYLGDIYPMLVGW